VNFFAAFNRVHLKRVSPTAISPTIINRDRNSGNMVIRNPIPKRIILSSGHLK